MTQLNRPIKATIDQFLAPKCPKCGETMVTLEDKLWHNIIHKYPEVK